MVSSVLASARIDSPLGTDVPDGWCVTTLGHLADLYQPETISAAKFKPHGYPVFGANGYVGYFDKYNHETWQVTVTCRGSTCGTVNRTVGQCWITGNSMVVNCDNNNNLHKEFLYHLLKYQDFRVCITGTGQPQIVRAPLASFPVSVPTSKIEQRAIAEALSDADVLIESLETLIAKKRAIKSVAMQDLLSGLKRLPGFEGDWAVHTLGGISSFITKGATPTTYGFGWQTDGVLFLRSECVSERGLDLSQSMFISTEAHNMLRRGEVCSGDILMTITGNVGRVVKLPEGFGMANMNQHIARIRVNAPGADRSYIYYQLSRPDYVVYFKSIITGQAYPQISLAQVRNTVVPIPSLEEQVAIASVLSDIDAEIANQEARLSKAKHVKIGMMEQLLTGKVRLV